MNQPNAQGLTPLGAATQNRQEATMAVLKAHGAQQRRPQKTFGDKPAPTPNIAKKIHGTAAFHEGRCV